MDTGTLIIIGIGVGGGKPACLPAGKYSGNRLDSPRLPFSVDNLPASVVENSRTIERGGAFPG